MTERPYNRVMLNLPAEGNGSELPEQDAPVVMIDGIPIHNVMSVTVAAGGQIRTAVSITFFAEVGGLAVSTMPEALKGR